MKSGNLTSQGDAHLESAVLALRGDFPLSIPLSEIHSVVDKEGKLAMFFPDGKAIFFIGATAEKWVEKISHPKSLPDKLGVSSDSKVAVWVVSLKGKNANIKDVDVMHAARKVGLVDNKVVSFSDTHTALKLVIPKSQRAN